VKLVLILTAIMFAARAATLRRGVLVSAVCAALAVVFAGAWWAYDNSLWAALAFLPLLVWKDWL
jgi:hypothetical protein